MRFAWCGILGNYVILLEKSCKRSINLAMWGVRKVVLPPPPHIIRLNYLNLHVILIFYFGLKYLKFI
jgi:hypothetical protein